MRAYAPADEHADPEVLLAEYQKLEAEVADLRDKLKAALAAALERPT